MTWPRDVRTRLLLVVLTAVAVALVIATIGFNVLLARSNDQSADSLLRQRADSERSLIRVAGGHVARVETSSDEIGDSRVWIFAGGRIVEAPRRATTTADARALAGGPGRFATVERTDERLYALPIVANGKRVGTIVTGISLAPYEQARRSALVASLVFAATVLLIAGAAAAWLLRSALRPVQLMTEQADAWSEHDLDRRFGLGEPHDELTRLASTLDRLLDRIAASLRHERRFSAELSHELRTPLAKVTAEAELALRRPRDAGGVPRGSDRDPRQRAPDRSHRRRAPRRCATGCRPARGLRRCRGRARRRRRVPAGRRRAWYRADGRGRPPALPGRGRRRSGRAYPPPGARERLPIRTAHGLPLARARRRRRALHRRRRRPRRRRRRGRDDLRARRAWPRRGSPPRRRQGSGSPSRAGSHDRSRVTCTRSRPATGGRFEIRLPAG